MTGLAAHRSQKDEWLRTAPDSPIPNQEGFDGLAYYEPAAALSFTVTPDPADKAPITIQTSDGRERTYTRDFTVVIEIDDQPVTVALYGTPHGLFLPFRDATSGTETYGAGRYVDVGEPAADGSITIDFNHAYNPFCAYNDRYSCPLPPAENWLSVPIRAGERAFERR